MRILQITSALCLAALVLLFPQPGWSAAAGFCNPWFPTPEGARWEYEETSGAGRARAIRSVVVISARKDDGNEIAELRQTVREAARKSQARAAGITEVRCQGGDLTLTTRGAAQGKSGSAKATGRVTAVIPGLPAANLLKPGYRWRSASRIEAQEPGTTIVVDGKRESRIGKASSIQVPAGDFSDVLLVEIRQTLSRAGSPPIDQAIREWYVRGVGLVQRETRVLKGTPDSFTTEKLRHFSR